MQSLGEFENGHTLEDLTLDVVGNFAGVARRFHDEEVFFLRVDWVGDAQDYCDMGIGRVGFGFDNVGERLTTAANNI